VQAARFGRLPVVQWLLDAGAGVKVRFGAPTGVTGEEWSAVSFAAQSGSLELVKLLVEHGAELNPEWFTSPLMPAAENGHLDTVKYLVGKGAQLENPYGQRAVWLAAQQGHDAVVAWLLSKGASLNHALAGAAAGPSAAAVTRLVDAGADVNWQEPRDPWRSPLRMANDSQRYENVRVLLERGANPDQARPGGGTPRSDAVALADPRLLGLYRQAAPDGGR